MLPTLFHEEGQQQYDLLLLTCLMEQCGEQPLPLPPVNTLQEKRKEKLMLFSDHSGSLPRWQPGARTHCKVPAGGAKLA